MRNAAIAASVSWGYTLKDIADHLHIHYATASKALKRGGDRKSRLEARAQVNSLMKKTFEYPVPLR